MSTTKVVLFDLWRTLVQSHCREPVWDLQRSLGHGLQVEKVGGQPSFLPDDEFLKFCLTTNILDPDAFVDALAHKFGCSPTDPARRSFKETLRKEAVCTSRYIDVKPTLRALQQMDLRLGVVSNLWAFPAAWIFEGDGLGKYFPRESRIYSFEVGHRKPDPEIFLHACRVFGVLPEECLFVGDNLEADVKGALRVGMKAALINREGLVADEEIPEGVLHLKLLTELIEHLQSEGFHSSDQLTLFPHSMAHGLLT